MATWDGSYSGTDDQNYYVYSDQNVNGPAPENWTYIANNVNNGHVQTNREYYVQNEPVFEPNCPPVFYNMNPALSSVPVQIVPSTMKYLENSMEGIPRIPGNTEYFSNSVKASQCFPPGQGWSNNVDQRPVKNNEYSLAIETSTADMAGQSNLQDVITNEIRLVKKLDSAGQSNFQVAANEFVPHTVKFDKRRNRSEMDASLLANTRDSYNEDAKLKPVMSDQLSYDRNKYGRRGTGDGGTIPSWYGTKRSANYKQKDGQQGRFPKANTYKNSYRQQSRNYDKFQADKYSSSRQYSDKTEEGVADVYSKKSVTDKINDSDACNHEINNVSTINVKEDESSKSTNVDMYTNTKSNETSEEVNAGRRDDIRQNGRGRRYNNHIKEYVYQNSSNRQGHQRNSRKYPFNMKQDRDETDYKEMKHNYHGYNGVRDSYSRDERTEMKEKVYNHREHNGFRNCYNKENKTESKEKWYNYQGHNGFREYYNKENKTEIFEEKDRNKNVPEIKEKVNENWRSKKENNEKGGAQRRAPHKRSLVDDDASQRERLTDQLNKGQLECLVCCEYIKQTNYIWSCSNCYHVLHLKCITKWARSSQGENGWRCPACQNVSVTVPDDYFCFCGKTTVPEWNRRDVAHSCGEVCGRTLSKNNCVHKCTLLCHPGSCPVCTALVTKFCGCGRTSQTIQCSTHTLIHCDAVCGRELNCGRHTCERTCHHGECGRCESTVEQACYCGKNTRKVTCQSNVSFTYSCETVCGKLLDCGNHTCDKLCHEDACEPCLLTPERITTCCCGQTPSEETRISCLDPIPTCDKICSKNLKCGQPNNPHTCKVNCHQGECPECDLTTDVKCRCGNMDRELACKDLTSKADDARCEKRCTKKRSCGKHKCNQLCCIDIEHICPLSCSKTLSCGRHKCEQSCHKGRCQPCWRSSFDELYCECGASVIFPPVPCGTRRPACDRPCSRQHTCGHEVLHSCHREPICPPCSVLTQRWCHGRHELRKAVPCHVTEISCGLPCNKPLSCGRHKCINICHPGSCEKSGQVCVQPCTTPREMCGHACAVPCHEGKCPDTPCKEMVKVTCQCGHRTMSRVCAENSQEYQRIASSILASKMADMQLGHSINLEEVFGQGAKKQNQLKTLDCNDECKTIERSRRLALGLQIVNPDLSGKLMPRYSDFMKQWAKKDLHFCQMVHEKLTELVQLAKTSKQKSRSYSFDSMNKDKRHFIHESCEHFGCESQAYDREPKRNVVATAVKDKCWLPSYSLLEIVQRENGQRKVPGPMLSTSKADGSVKTILSLPVRESPHPATPRVQKCRNRK